MLSKIYTFAKTWKLPLAMIIGVILYYVFEATIPTDDIGGFYHFISHYFQPTLIFCMLFLSFLKVEPKELKPHRWHGVLLLTQGSLFVLCSLAALICRSLSFGENGDGLIIWEGAMLCFICPTATASAVIVQKLGGSLSGDVTYLVLCNLMVSILAPCFLPLVEPNAAFSASLPAGNGWGEAFFLIMGKVFPLLLCPLFVALIIRHYAPRLMERMLSIPDLAFYMWLVALALAITVTVKTIIESHIAIGILLALAAVSAVCCIIQFDLGRAIGRHWVQPTKTKSEVKRFTKRWDKPIMGSDPVIDESVEKERPYVDEVERSAITAGQAFGQKNTVFIIWMGLMFLNPVTSVVGGLYSIWHNCVNSYQLYKKNN